MLLFGYFLCVFLTSPCTGLKGITFAFVAFLFSCQRTGLAERAARLPDPSVRVKRNVSNALPRELIPVDPDTCTASVAVGMKRSDCRTADGNRCCLFPAGTADSRSPVARLSTSHPRRELVQRLAPASYSTASGSSVTSQMPCGCASYVRFSEIPLPRRDHT